MKTFREIAEINEGAETKNNISTVKKELAKEFGRDIQIIGQYAAESGKRAGDIVAYTNDRVEDKGMWYTQTVFEVNGKILVVYKSVGTNKGLGYIVLKSKKELTQNWAHGKNGEIRDASLYNCKNSSDKATWDLTELIDILKG